MTGNYDLYRAAFRQSGLIEVHDIEEIVDIAKLFAQGRTPKGRSVGVLSISGGSGIVFADRAVKLGLTLPSFSEQTVTALRAIIPTFGSSENPADTTAGVFNDPTMFSKTLEIVLADPVIDQLSVILVSISGPAAAKACQAIVDAAETTDKPVHVVWSGRRAKSEAAWNLLDKANIPFITTPVRMARAAAVLANFADDQRRLLPRTPPPAALAQKLNLPEGAVTLSEFESKAVLRSFSIPVTRELLGS